MANASTSDEIKLEKIKEVYDAGYGYHTLKFPNGVVIQGMYDMSKVLHLYQIPDDLTGKTVLDIGPGNGYFSTELDKRGAKVVAIDRHDHLWRDEINELMGTKIEFKVKDVNELDESFGKFDIVFCSNVIQHNSDMFDFIERIRSVTKEMAILCIQIIQIPKIEHVPIAQFIGKIKKNPDGERVGTFWLPNMKCLQTVAETAGFRTTKEISRHLVYGDKIDVKSTEGIIHCYV